MSKYFLAIIFLSNSTFAHEMTGNEIYGKYQAEMRAWGVEKNDVEEMTKEKADTGYFGDLIEGETYAGNSCPPEQVAPEQTSDIVGISDIVERYLINHPERRKHNASSLIMEALDEAFPCKKNDPGKQ